MDAEQADKQRRSGTRAWLVALFFVALAARVAIFFARRSAPLSLDSIDYLACARAILNGHGWPSALRPPGWPLVLAWALAAGGGDAAWAGLVVNVGLSAAVAPLAAIVAGRFLPPRRAWFAGLVVALHPSLLFLTPALLTEPLTWFLTTFLALRLLVPARPGLSDFVNGLIAGELYLVRAAAILLVPATLFPARRRTLGQRTLGAAWTALGAGAIVATTLVFVHFRTGLAGSAAGSAEHMLWMGASPARLVAEKEIGSFPRDLAGMEEAKVATAYRNEAFSDYAGLWQKSPLTFLAFPFRKLWALHELTSSGKNRLLALAFQLPLTILALIGALTLRRRGDAESWRSARTLVILVTALAIPPLVTMPWTRYYSPLIPLLVPLAAAVGLPRKTGSLLPEETQP